MSLGAAQREPVIRASEVGHYAYCRRAWWLRRVCGYEPQNWQALERGVERHEAHGARAAYGEARLQLAKLLVLAGLVCGMLLVVLMAWR
jgi:hypothetical protein